MVLLLFHFVLIGGVFVSFCGYFALLFISQACFYLEEPPWTRKFFRISVVCWDTIKLRKGDLARTPGYHAV